MHRQAGGKDQALPPARMRICVAVQHYCIAGTPSVAGSSLPKTPITFATFPASSPLILRLLKERGSGAVTGKISPRGSPASFPAT